MKYEPTCIQGDGSRKYDLCFAKVISQGDIRAHFSSN